MVFDSQTVHVARVGHASGSPPVLKAWDSYPREGGDLNVLKRLRGARRLERAVAPCCCRIGNTNCSRSMHPRYRRPKSRRGPLENQGCGQFSVEDAASTTCRPCQEAVRTKFTPWRLVVPSCGHRIRLFQEARAPLDAIDVPELAQRNIAARFEDAHRGLALLAFDGTGGRFNVHLRWRAVLTPSYRCFPRRSVPMPPPTCASACCSMFSARSTTSTAATAEFRSPACWCRRRPEYENLSTTCAENLYQPVEALDLGQRIDLTGFPVLAHPVGQGQALLAIGAALRGEEAPT